MTASRAPVRRSRRVRLLTGCVAALLIASGAAPVAAADDGTDRAVIVQAGSTDAAVAAVIRAGGRVGAPLDVVHGVAARVDDAGLLALRGDPELRVTPDLKVHATGADFDPAATDTQLAAMTPGEDWSSEAGEDVAVALVDTGVNETSDLRGHRLVRGPDLSGEGDGVDRYGHGTFMAGLIAGDGHASADGPIRHMGIAPGATVVAIKVAGADGSTTLSKLVAGIGWAVVHRDDHDIRVLNLSFGADLNLPYVANPLSGAVEAAWASGITVVTAAGNEGDGLVTSPGDDPWVVTAGASDTRGTASPADDALAPWSGREDFSRYAKPDVVAPGVSVISLRAPGSTIDAANPSARVDGTYFRGSGTSMATALVSGAAAVLLGDHPDATPDDVKGALVDGGASIAGSAAPAVSLAGSEGASPRPEWWQRFPIAFDGLGRGLRERMPWTASRWTASRWTASRWTASRWTASRWTASRWTASRWTASRWTDAEWTASRWTASRWTASRWTASRWTDASWNARAWG